MTLSTLPMSRAVKTPRVSPCEPLCARLGAGVAVYPPRGYSAHTGRIPERHKNGKYAAVTRGRPAFQRYEAHAEGSDTTPAHRSAKKMRNGSFYHLPQQGSRRNPAKRFRWEEDERQRARVLPLAAGRGIRRPLGRRPASHLSGLRRNRCPAKRTGRAKPCTQIPGRSPDPLLAMIGEKHEKRYQIQHAHGVR